MMTTMVKETGIPFSEEMTRAVMNDRKMQTRRGVKNLIDDFDHCDRIKIIETGELFFRFSLSISGFTTTQDVECPYGQIGDRLWVREPLVAISDTKIDPDEKMPIAMYAADGSHLWTKERFRVPWKWKPKRLGAMYMPRKLSRITLEITDVRVERLNDISEADCEAEGPTRMDAGQFGLEQWRSAFRNLWIDVNGHGSWEKNPWVWAITFKKV